MKIIADLVPRFAHLQSLQDDPMVINTNGTRVDALVEIAAEIYDVPVAWVTFEQRNWAQRIVHGALAADINRQSRSSGAAQEAAFKQAFGNNSSFTRGSSGFQSASRRPDPLDEALRQNTRHPWWPENK